MKSNEFLDEGLLDKVKSVGSAVGGAIKSAVGKTGALGREAQVMAYAQDREKETGAQQKVATSMVKNRFVADLQNALTKAISSGVVAAPVPTPESFEYNYNQFSRLLESKILKEAGIPVKQYIVNYMNALFRNYGRIGPEYQTRIDTIADEIEAAYTTPNGKFPADKAGILFDIAMDVKRQYGQDKSKTQQYQSILPPKNNIDPANALKTQNYAYTFDVSSQTWSQWPLASPGTGSPSAQFDASTDQFDQLNRLFARGAHL